MIKTEDKQWRQWKINVVSELYPRKRKQNTMCTCENIIDLLDQPIQFPYPLELRCNNDINNADDKRNETKKLNVKAREFVPN